MDSKIKNRKKRNFSISIKKRKNLIKNKRKRKLFDIFDKNSLLNTNTCVKISKNPNFILKTNILKKQITFDNFEKKFKSFLRRDFISIEKKSRKLSLSKQSKKYFKTNKWKVKIDFLKIQKIIKIFLKIFYFFFNTNNTETNLRISIKDFIKKYIIKKRIKNKKFKFLFLTQKLINLKKEKKQFKFLINFLLFFPIYEVQNFKKVTFNLEIKEKFFDQSFNQEIQNFLNYLIFKIEKFQKTQIQSLKKKSLLFLNSIKNYLKIKKIFVLKINYKNKNKMFINKKKFFFKKKFANKFNSSFIDRIHRDKLIDVLTFNKEIKNFLDFSRSIRYF